MRERDGDRYEWPEVEVWNWNDRIGTAECRGRMAEAESEWSFVAAGRSSDLSLNPHSNSLFFFFFFFFIINLPNLIPYPFQAAVLSAFPSFLVSASYLLLTPFSLLRHYLSFLFYSIPFPVNSRLLLLIFSSYFV